MDRMTVFYNDTPDRVSRISGLLISKTNMEIFLKVGNKDVSIPYSRVIRTEIEREVDSNDKSQVDSKA